MRSTYGLSRSNTDSRASGRRMIQDVYDARGKYIKTILLGPFRPDGLDEIRRAKWMKSERKEGK